MHTKSTPLAFIICQLVSLSIFSSQYSFAQGSASHGGDIVVLQFKETAKSLLAVYKSTKLPPVCPLARDLELVVEKSTVTSIKKVLIGDTELDAENNAKEMSIKLSRTRLNQIDDSRMYLELVLHEYFGLLSLEDTNDNHLSSPCLAAALKKGPDPETIIKGMDRDTTFESDLLNGRAGLKCQNFVFLFDVKERQGAPLLTKIVSPNVLKLENQSDPIPRSHLPKLQNKFERDYDIETGEESFLATSWDQFSKYTLRRLNHKSWTVSCESDSKYSIDSNSTNNYPYLREWKNCTKMYFSESPAILPWN